MNVYNPYEREGFYMENRVEKRSKLKSLAEKKPILFGIVSVVVVFALYGLASMGSFSLVAPFIGSSPAYLFGGILRIIFSVPAIILLGYTVQANGFKYAFSTRGFAKSIFAGIPILIYFATIIPMLFLFRIHADFAPTIPAFIFQQITVGLFEESLFRGLMMTALIARYCDKARNRFFVVLICGFLFGVLHVVNTFASGDDTIAISVIVAGIAFSVVYLYSKNLLGCMVLHAIYDILIGIYGVLIVDVGNETVFQSLQSISTLALLAMPLLAIPWIVMAKPLNLLQHKLP